MSSITLLRIAARTTCLRSNGIRSILPRTPASVLMSSVTATKNFSTTRPAAAADEEGHGGHHEESFEEFTARYGACQLVPARVDECFRAFCSHVRDSAGNWDKSAYECYTDMKRNSTRFKTSLSFRYVILHWLVWGVLLISGVITTAKPEQRICIRSRPIPLGPRGCIESRSPSQRFPNCR